mmetsp:Transcript_54203/g.139985  ORF Transcript_54203/g.139985 Transcript_54203/m.139985 type:complete len:87 (-) Transcript_54203:2112-2372(-)
MIFIQVQYLPSTKIHAIQDPSIRHPYSLHTYVADPHRSAHLSPAGADWPRGCGQKPAHCLQNPMDHVICMPKERPPARGLFSFFER